MRQLEFGILGPLEVREGGRPLALGGVKQRALLAILLLQPNEVVSTDQLIDRLWPSEPPAHPEHAVQVFVSRLRKSLGKDVLETRAPGYRLAVQEGSLDAGSFVDLVDRARRARESGDPRAARLQLDQALALWRGEALADFAYEGFAAAHIERLDEERILALEERIEARLDLGEHEELVGEIQELVRDHPLRERMRRLLMLALYRSGRQTEALDVYIAAREELIEQRGLEPGPELHELHRAILNQDESLESPRSRKPAGNLPVPPTPLIGRRDELAHAQTMLLDEGTRVLTLTGPGGTGKTRLALELAAMADSDFDDGVFFVALAGVDDGDGVLPAVARTLGVAEQPERDLEEALRSFLNGRRLLLVLDNFEQVMSAAPFVSRMAAASLGVKVLVTSRNRLRIAAEQVFDLPPLEGSDAEAFFLARARAADADFAAGDAETIAQICVRLDGLPLALELAAARAPLFSPSGLLARLDSRLAFLTAGARDADQRQQTLRSAIEWSYDLLDPSERALFSRLAVFTGGWSLDAAEAVCGADELDVLNGLASLVDKSLVRRRDGISDQPRFRMLETIREYALERFESSSDAELVRLRHAEWCRDLTVRAQPELVGPEQARWRDRLEVDYPNLRAAAAWASTTAPDVALAIVARLQEFWEPRGYLREARQTLDQVLRATDGHDTRDRVDAMNAAGWFAFCAGDLESADEQVGRALQLASAIEYERGLAVGACHRAWIAYYRDEYPEAVALGEQSLRTLGGLDAPLERAEALALLGNVASAKGDYAEARELLERSAELSRSHGNASALAYRLGDLGFIDRLEGDFAAAAARFDDALALATRIEQKSGRAYALLNLAAITLREKPALSRAYADEALQLARATGEKSAVAQALTALAEAAAGPEAEALVRESLVIYVELSDRLATVRSLEMLAVLAFRDGRAERGVLLGAAASSLRSQLDLHHPAWGEGELEAAIAAQRAAFEEAWARGSALALDDAVAEALDRSATFAVSARS